MALNPIYVSYITSQTTRNWASMCPTFHDNSPLHASCLLMQIVTRRLFMNEINILYIFHELQLISIWYIIYLSYLLGRALTRTDQNIFKDRVQRIDLSTRNLSVEKWSNIFSVVTPTHTNVICTVCNGICTVYAACGVFLVCRVY